jgi:hypothetical protein
MGIRSMRRPRRAPSRNLLHAVAPVALGLAALAAGCGYTTVDNVWRAPLGADPPRQRIAVIGLTKDELLKRNFEDHFVKVLKDRGNQAVAGYTFLTEAVECDSASICNSLGDQGFDGILTARVVSTDKQVDYVPGSTTYVPETAYTAYHRYYYTVYREETTPAYEKETEYVRVETNLYDAVDLHLLWAAATTTQRQDNQLAGIKDYSKVIIKDLAKSGFIK